MLDEYIYINVKLFTLVCNFFATPDHCKIEVFLSMATNPIVRLSDYNPAIVKLAREFAQYMSTTPILQMDVEYEARLKKQANRIEKDGGAKFSYLSIIMQGSPNTKIGDHWANTYTIIE